jgi:hypothetical protein
MRYSKNHEARSLVPGELSITKSGRRGGSSSSKVGLTLRPGAMVISRYDLRRCQSVEDGKRLRLQPGMQDYIRATGDAFDTHLAISSIPSTATVAGGVSG